MRGRQRAAALALMLGLPGAAGAAECQVKRLAELPVTMANGYQPMVTAKMPLVRLMLVPRMEELAIRSAVTLGSDMRSLLI